MPAASSCGSPTARPIRICCRRRCWSPASTASSNKRDPGKRLDIDMYAEGHTVKDAKKLPLNLLDALRALDKSSVLKAASARTSSPPTSSCKHDDWNEYSAPAHRMGAADDARLLMSSRNSRQRYPGPGNGLAWVPVDCAGRDDRRTDRPCATRSSPSRPGAARQHGLDAGVARCRAQARLRRGHRRRRRARARDRLLSRQGARHHQRRRAGEGLDRLGNVGRNTTIIRSNYLLPGNIPFYEWSMKLWEGLEQDLNYNAMVSQRGVLNLYHSDAQRDAFARRGNAMRLHGVDAELLDREQVRGDGALPRLRQRALSDPRRPAAAARRHGAPRRGRLGLCARRPTSAASTSSRTAR